MQFIILNLIQLRFSHLQHAHFVAATTTAALLWLASFIRPRPLPQPTWPQFAWRCDNVKQPQRADVDSFSPGIGAPKCPGNSSSRSPPTHFSPRWLQSSSGALKIYFYKNFRSAAALLVCVYVCVWGERGRGDWLWRMGLNILCTFYILCSKRLFCRCSSFCWCLSSAI